MPCITQAPAILTGEASATSTLLPSPNIARSAWGRLRYRLYRHPLVMFGIGPAYLFILQYRLPVGMMRSGWRPWASTMGINLAISLIVGVTRLAHRDQSIPTHSPSDHAARVVSRGLAVLCATSIRGHDMGGGERVRFAPSRLARQLSLRPARVSALVYGKYRRSSRASPMSALPLRADILRLCAVCALAIRVTSFERTVAVYERIQH